jgi:RES domain-containing protein
MDLWRISGFQSLSGEGGLHYAGRWHHAGRRVVYLAESPAGALIEALVHLELNADTWPAGYELMRVTAPGGIRIEAMQVPAGEGWRKTPALSRALGDDWLRSKRTALARVPSAILPETWNVLLNPEHPAARRVRIADVTRAEYDSRLLPKVR